MSRHSDGDGLTSGDAAMRCTICSKPRSQDYRPFCSKRCADVDLGRWLKGDYAIPVGVDDDEDGDTADVSHGPAEHGGKDDWNG